MGKRKTPSTFQSVALQAHMISCSFQVVCAMFNKYNKDQVLHGLNKFFQMMSQKLQYNERGCVCSITGRQGVLCLVDCVIFEKIEKHDDGFHMFSYIGFAYWIFKREGKDQATGSVHANSCILSGIVPSILIQKEHLKKRVQNWEMHIYR